MQAELRIALKQWRIEHGGALDRIELLYAKIEVLEEARELEAAENLKLRAELEHAAMWAEDNSGRVQRGKLLTFALAQANNSARNELSVQEKLIDELRKKNLEQDKSDQQQGTSARLRAAAMANLRAAEATVESQEAEISKLVALVEQYEGLRKLRCPPRKLSTNMPIC